MRNDTKTMERRPKTFKYYSSVFFNLLVIAILLTAIVVLHQILKKPKTGGDQAVKSVAALPASPPVVKESTPAAPEPVAVVDLQTPPETEKPAEKKTVKTKTIKWKKVKRKSYSYSKGASQWAEGPKVEELDNAAARERYLQENERLSEGIDTSASPTPSAHYYESDSSSYARASRSAHYGTPIGESVQDLDNENARQRYLEENRRLSGDLAYERRAYKGKPESASYTSSSSGSDEYIPFERK